MILDIICRVIDNYGDIGVTWRLCRALLDVAPTLHLRLIVDRLDAFAQLEPLVDVAACRQVVCGVEVIVWNKDPPATLTQFPCRML